MNRQFVAEKVFFPRCYHHQDKPGQYKINSNENRKTKYLCEKCYSQFKLNNPVLEKYSVDLVIPLQNYGKFKTRSYVKTKGKFGWENWKKTELRGNAALGFYHLLKSIELWEEFHNTELEEKFDRNKQKYLKIGEYVYTLLGNPVFVLDENLEIQFFF